MEPGMTVCKVLKLADQISSSLGLFYSFDSLKDVNICFLEDVLRQLCDFKPDDLSPIIQRYEACLDHLSNLTLVPMFHINSEDLYNLEIVSVYNLLEIIAFLVDYASDEIHKRSSSSSSPTQFNSTYRETSSPEPPFTKISKSMDLMAVSRLAESLLLDDKRLSNRQSTATAGRQSHPIELTSDLDGERSPPSADDLNKRQFKRLNYLREKLLECLQAEQNNSNAPSVNDTQILTNDANIQTTVTHRLSGTGDRPRTAIPQHALNRPPTGLVKPCNRPLVRFGHPTFKSSSSHNPTPPTKPPDSRASYLLKDILDELPMLQLDTHSSRNLRQKAADCLSAAAPLSCSQVVPPAHRLTWVEERQQRRFAQMLRHELQADRILSKRLNGGPAADRAIRAQLQERRRQLVRARNHYRQFVQEFRARKIAKILEEERIFRFMFEQLLNQEREEFRELHTMEREDRRLRERQQAFAIENREASHRSRLVALNSELDEERKKHVAIVRQERLDMKKRERELRLELERSIREMQQVMLANTDSAYFRSKDADRVLRTRRKIPL